MKKIFLLQVILLLVLMQTTSSLAENKNRIFISPGTKLYTNSSQQFRWDLDNKEGLIRVKIWDIKKQEESILQDSIESSSERLELNIGQNHNDGQYIMMIEQINQNKTQLLLRLPVYIATKPIKKESIENIVLDKTYINVYPNPINDEKILNIDLSFPNELYCNITVCAIDGQNIINKSGINLIDGKNHLELRLTHVSSGVYLIHVTGNSGSTVSDKFIIQ